MSREKPKRCRVCGKRIFHTERQARECITHLLARILKLKRQDFSLNVYRGCESGWHFGHDHKTLAINFKKGTHHATQENRR